jgi:hypothetical protein
MLNLFRLRPSHDDAERIFVEFKIRKRKANLAQVNCMG